MRPPGPGLRFPGEGKRRAHFPAHRLGNILETLVIGGKDALKQSQPLGPVGDGESRKRTFGGSDGPIDIAPAADRDRREGFFGGGIDHIEKRRLHRVDPCSADEELQILGHAGSDGERGDVSALFATCRNSASTQGYADRLSPTRMGRSAF